MRTTFITKPKEVKREWFVVDATGHTLGRLASEIAKILHGKHKAIFAPHVDTGDYVIVINAEKIRVTGKKLNQKFYRHHSGYPGGVKDILLKDMLVRKPEFVISHAVRGMLPKNNLGRAMFKKLYVYAGSEHEHAAQKPIELKIKKNNLEG